VTVAASDALQVRAGGRISSDTFAAGDAGDVRVTARQVTVDGAGFGGFTGISSDANRDSGGDAGTVTVNATEPLTVVNGGSIGSNTFAAGDAGTVEVTAGRLTVDGGFFGGFTGISSDANNLGFDGDAGTVTVAASDALQVRAGGRISSDTFAAGDAGDVRVTAGRLTVDDGGLLDTFISSGTFGAGDAGDAGNVRVTALEELTVNGGSVATNSDGPGRAGDVAVAAPRLRIDDEGLIGSSGRGSGAAGSVTLGAGTLEVEEASVRTEGTGAQGGRIEVAAGDRIYLRDSEVTSNGIEPAAGASLITLRAPELILNASTVTSLTGAGAPLAGSGEARLFGELTVISADSVVAGSSSVEISGLQTNLGSDLRLPEGTFLDVSRLLRASCAATGGGPRSSFTRGGRGGLPPAPDRPLPSAGAEGTAGGAGKAADAGASGFVFLDACAAGPPSGPPRS
jgi:hypothetical protein